jgi:hypothetical protein
VFTTHGAKMEILVDAVRLLTKPERVWLRILPFAVLCAVVVLQSGCGGNGQSQQAFHGVALDSVSPLPTANGPTFNMQVNGEGFAPAATLQITQGTVNGQPITTFVSDKQLVVAIPANAFPFAETVMAWVYSPNTPCFNQYCSLTVYSKDSSAARILTRNSV